MKELLTKQEEEMLNKMMDAEEESLREAAEFYRNVPIPESLQDMVARTIEEHTEKERGQDRMTRRKRKTVILIRTIGALVAAVILFMIPLNMSEAFAKQMQGVPVLGVFARVLTIRSYSYTENDVNVNVQVPEITLADDETAENVQTPADCGVAAGGAGAAAGDAAGDAEILADGGSGILADAGSAGSGETSGAEKIADVNAEILRIVETYEADAKQRFEEYKEAFFATGGTEEEWGGRTCEVNVEYAVTYQDNSRLSLILTTTESWVAVYAQRYYYNLDLQTGETLTLRDLLGENWKERCNECITAEIERRIAEEEDVVYWGYGPEADDYMMADEGFQSVSGQTNFYINENGNVVVCFDKYEIAPGYMGMQEFEITDAE